MIRNIVFDIGNVLVDYCWQDHIAHYGFKGEKADRIAHAMMLGPDWKELDRGVLRGEEFRRLLISKAPELEQEILLLMSDLSTLVRRREGSIPWIQDLKARGYHTYYLSNYGEQVRYDTAASLDFMKEMDGGIMSYEVHQIKPDEKIYRMLLDRYHLKAEESIFLDDTNINVDGAIKVGMQGLLVENQEQAVRDLNALLKQQD
ncbi:HAD family phosphatase [Clostridiaceae bacterium Marseille-Q4145]|nr:HAD family phosphatase [Clostridiaceae bacterium Marseille-Q4145]